MQLGRAVAVPNDSGSIAERPIPGWVAQHRGAVQATLDLACWVSALVAAVLQRHDFDAQAVHWNELGLYLTLLVGVAIPVAAAAGLYRSRWQFGSYEEVAALACVAGSVGVSAGLVNRFVINRWVPVGASITAPVFALVLMFAARYIWRGWIDRKLRPEPSKAQRIIVFGAGEAGRQAVVSMMRNPASRYLPVALLDDDATKRGQRIRNLSVVGTRADLFEVARKMDASAVLIAIPSAGAVVVRELVRLAREAKIETRVLPSLDELPTGEVTEHDIRVVSEADLLGRRHIQTDVASIAGYLTGKRVLVTGAGGSIGSELCRQLSRLNLNRWSCWTEMSPVCMPCNSPLRDVPCWTPRTWWWLTFGTGTAWMRCSGSTARRWCSTPRRSNT